MSPRRPSCSGTALAYQHAQDFSDESGLGFAFDLQRALQLEEYPPVALELGRSEGRTHAHACVSLDGSNKPDPIEAVVEPSCRIVWDHADFRYQCSEQGQGEIAMGNRPTERTFAPGAIGIDVDPLSIAGAGGELIDAILGHRHPVRDSQ